MRTDARRLITHLLSGEAKRSDFDAADLWRRQSPAHEREFAEAARLWRNLGAAGRDLVAQEGVPVWPSPAAPMSRRAMLVGGGALAAAAASAAVVMPPLGLWPSLDELRADYRTATGEQRRLMLPGDVAVRMNTQTAISVPVSHGDLDQITLIAGEASFEVPAQAARALVVAADSGLTIGSVARFDIRNFGNSVCVTCSQGKVRVESGPHVATLGANQQLRYDRAGLGQTVSVNPNDAAAWLDGVLIFRDTPLADVIAELNRYRPGKIVLMRSALANRTVNGRFRVDRIDDVLTWLAQAYGARTRSLPGGVMLVV
ncbi:FecR family protein [Rhodopseudomonas palustris]|uniref:FecR family protein n=1 Tax=Rhodopseudomonas palustris TaxID=1076 RepID=UPI001FD9C9D6|nr:FecR domain-containing protein [Rhodopseudomonas palustris]